MNRLEIGFIGIGIMGEPMARNLLQAGHSLTVFTRTRSKAQALLTDGATWADSPAAVARAADTVISIVNDSPDAHTVYLGAEGVCGGLGRSSTCSASRPSIAATWAADSSPSCATKISADSICWP